MGCAGKSPHTPREQPVESAGIPDLADAVAADDRLRTDHVQSGAILAGSKSKLIGRVSRLELLADESEIDRRPLAASHRLEFRIDKFTNHDDLLQRVG
jgi:hypothetical protein